MSAPMTLLQMTGADLTPASMTDAALVMVDLQNEDVTGGLPLPGVDAAVTQAAELLERARAQGTTVIHVAHAGRPGGAFDRADARGQIISAVEPAPGEQVVEKPRPNAFSGTNLKAVVDSSGRKKLIVTGFMTHMCVSSTVRAALDLGYFSTVVADACASRDLPGTNGAALPAATIHEAALAALSDRFAVVVPRASDIPD